MTWRQLEPTRWDQIGIGIMLGRQVRMNRLHHLGLRIRTGYSQYAGVGLFDNPLLGTETTGNDHLAILIQSITNGLQRLLHCSIDKSAGIDHHQICISIFTDKLITFCAKLGKNVFGIDCRLGTAETDKTDLLG